MKKDARNLYTVLSTILDCDYIRLVDAFDDVENDILNEAILNALEIYDSLSLENIMQEVIETGLKKIETDFYKECDSILQKCEKINGKESEEYNLLSCFEISDLRDSLICEDGVIEWSNTSSVFSEEEMVILKKHLPDSFKKLQESIGNIINLPL